VKARFNLLQNSYIWNFNDFASLLKKIVMKTLIFIVILLVGYSVTAFAQQKHTDTNKVRFAPPILKKKNGTVQNESRKDVKFTPPVIKKDKQSKSNQQKRSEVVKFKPPVLKKDSVKKQ
jgi:hypothetical protein